VSAEQVRGREVLR